MMESEKRTAVSRNKDVSLDEIEARKKLLKEKITGIENKYTRKVTNIETKVRKSLKPIRNIREKPLKAVGTSIAVGFIVGILGRKKSRSATSSKSHEGGGSGSASGFTSILLSELKRLAAHKAMVYVSDLVDHTVMPKIKNKSSEKDENQRKQPGKS